MKERERKRERERLQVDVCWDNLMVTEANSRKKYDKEKLFHGSGVSYKSFI